MPAVAKLRGVAENKEEDRRMNKMLKKNIWDFCIGDMKPDLLVYGNAIADHKTEKTVL